MTAPDDVRSFGPRGRFEAVRRLGEGGFGVVWEVHDRERDRRVALKRWKRHAPSELRRLKGEFRALAELDHPHLLALHELWIERGDAFFTMDLVDGVDVVSWASGRSSGPAPSAAHTLDDVHPASVRGAPPSSPLAERVARLERIVPQLVAGLRALHERGVVHRDLKPSNVLVDAEGRARILDYGLVAPSGASAARFEGTPAYAAPEQGLREATGPASDVYALGAIAFEVLAGRLPFEGDALRVLANKAQRRAPRLGALAPGVPAALEALVDRMLARDPRDRPTLAEVDQELGAPAPPPSAVRRVPRAAGVSAAGREGELERLEARALRASTGRFEVASIEGPSGIGKTTLAATLRARLADAGWTVLEGRCSPREALPYNAFDAALDRLGRLLERGEIAPPPRDDAAVLARVFPALGVLEAGAVEDVPRGQRALRERAFEALARWLGAVATRGPVLLSLDDFHWADPDSRALFAALVQARPARVFVAVSARGGAEPLVLPWGALRLELGALSRDALLRAADAVLGPGAAGSAADVERAVERSGGHPMWFLELLSAESEAVASLDEALRRRVAALDPEARAVLDALSVAGAPLDEASLAEVCGAPVARVAPLLDRLVRERLVRRSAEEGEARVEPFHDRIREVVAAGVLGARRRAVHQALARAFSRSEAHHALVAHHLAEAGDLTQAAGLCEALAERAAGLLAFDLAARWLGDALRWGTFTDARRLALSLRRVELLELAHRSIGAAEELLAIRPLADGPSRRAMEVRAAELFLAAGDLGRGRELLATLLASVGAPLPASPLATLAAIAGERLSLRRRGLALAAPPADDGARRALEERAELLRGAAMGLGMCDNLRASLYHARALRAALDLGDPSRAAIAVAIESIFRGSTSSRARHASAPLLVHAEELARRAGDEQALRWVEAAHATRGALELAGPEAVHRLARIEARFREEGGGQTWAIDSMVLVRMLSLRVLGAVDALRMALPALAADAARRDDRYLETTLLRGAAWVSLADDDPDAARAAVGRTTWVPDDRGVHVQHWIELDALGEIALYEGRGAEASRALGPRFVALERALLSRLQRIRVLLRYLHGRLLVARAEAGDGARPALLGATAIASLLAREGVGYASAMAAALRASIAAVRGDERRVGEALDELARLAARHGLTALEAAADVASGARGRGDAERQRRAEEYARRERLPHPHRFAALYLPGVVPAALRDARVR